MTQVKLFKVPPPGRFLSLRLCLLGYIACIVLLLPVVKVWGQCPNARVIETKMSGSWTSAATWRGGGVPRPCDMVIIRHNVTLDVPVSIGGEKGGGLHIMPNASLSNIGGEPILSVSQGRGIINEGKLFVAALYLGADSTGGYFYNRGEATFTNDFSVQDTACDVRNNGTLKILGNMTMNGKLMDSAAIEVNGELACRHARIDIYAQGSITVAVRARLEDDTRLQLYWITSTLTTYGDMLLAGPKPSRVKNAGSIYVGGTRSLATGGSLELRHGYLSNKDRARLIVYGDLLMKGGKDSSAIDNRGSIILKRSLQVDKPSSCFNSDSLLVGEDVQNASYLFNALTGYIHVFRDFVNKAPKDALTLNDGIILIERDFLNDFKCRVTGTQYNGIKVRGYSVNNGMLDGKMDFCDSSAGPDKKLDVNKGTIGYFITYCDLGWTQIPLELTSFYANEIPQGNILYWETASESGIGQFQVLRSNDGIHYKEIGYVLGKGHDFLQQYSFTDAEAQPDAFYYYKLKRQDANGAVQYSRIISLGRYPLSSPEARLYPNPAVGGRLHIDMELEKGEDVQADVCNMAGLSVCRAKWAGVQGQNSLEMDVQALPPGFYFLTLKTGNAYRRMPFCK